ncbi:MAG: CvpA family protein [Lachnospiraceae bacterium]|nr:CvpA family protein [Lachnospiraceae bacterium]
MEFVRGLSARWVEIAAAAYLIGMMLYGHHRGFIRLCVSAAALLIAILSVRFAAPYVTERLKNDTPLFEVIRQGIEKTVGLDEGTPLPSGPSEERLFIEGLDLPEQMKRILLENNNGEIYKRLGVRVFRDYVTDYLADMILRILVFVGLFAAVYLILHVATVWLDLIVRLPILSGLNQIAGAVLGFIQALIFLWILCLIFTAFSGTGFGKAVLAGIEASRWLSWIYDHNMLSLLVFGFLKTVL